MKKFLHIAILSLIVLCFSGCALIVHGWRWAIPYSFEPSFHKFKEICQLDPEIYQANGGKIDEEYYNKVLAYFDTSLDKMDWGYIQQKSHFNNHGDFLYKFKKYDFRIYHSFTLFFKDNKAKFDNIEDIMFYARWRDLRPRLAGNEGTGIYWSGDIENCDYFKKGINNEK